MRLDQTQHFGILLSRIDYIKYAFVTNCIRQPRHVEAIESGTTTDTFTRGAVAPLLRRGGVEGPPTVRPAGGGGMFGAHGKIAYLSLPFCALMRASSARAAAAR